MKNIEVSDEELELILTRRENSRAYREAMFERNFKGGNWFVEHPWQDKKPENLRREQ